MVGAFSQEMCVAIVAENFGTYSKWHLLPDENKQLIIDILSVDVPLEYVAEVARSLLRTMASTAHLMFQVDFSCWRVDLCCCHEMPNEIDRSSKFLAPTKNKT